MDKDEITLLDGILERFNAFREELPNLSFNDQKQAITAFQAKLAAWEHQAQSLGMFQLMKEIRDIELPEAVDYESKKAIEAYIKEYSDDQGVDWHKAEDFFKELCISRHGSSFEAERCLKGHLKALPEYYYNKRIAAEKAKREEVEARKRAHLLNSFFGGE